MLSIKVIGREYSTASDREHIKETSKVTQIDIIRIVKNNNLSSR